LQVDTFSNAIAVSAGDQGSMVVTADGSVWVFGYDGSYGKFGMGIITGGNVPQKSTILSDVVDVVCSRYHSLFIKSNGTVWASGLNNKGQLGDGTTTNNPTPVQVIELSDVVDAAVGYNHSIFLKGDGTVWVVGGNGYGQLGDGTNDDRLTAIQLSTCGVVSNTPAAPTNLTLTPQKTQMAGQMELNWTDNSNDEDGFSIERSLDGNSWSVIGTSTAATYTDNGLQEGTLYYYQVAAYNGSGSSAYSNVVSGMTLAVGIDAPSSDNSVSVYPNPVANVLSFNSALPLQNAVVQLTDVSGKLIHSEMISANAMDVSQLPAGLYFGTISGSEISTSVFKFVKE
jgi:hypothetical protein